MRQVVLLNADFTFLDTLSWKRAIKLVSKGKVEIVKATKKFVRNFEETVSFYLPEVIRLIKFVRLVYKNKVPFTKRNVFVRDLFTCAYCGKEINKPSLDHIVPKSRGGEDSWENCVTSCYDCNGKKGNLTPNESKMYLKKRPKKPTIAEFMNCKAKLWKVEDIVKDLTS